MLVVNNGHHLRALVDEPQVHSHPPSGRRLRGRSPQTAEGLLYPVTLAYIGVGEKLYANLNELMNGPRCKLQNLNTQHKEG